MLHAARRASLPNEAGLGATLRQALGRLPLPQEMQPGERCRQRRQSRRNRHRWCFLRAPPRGIGCQGAAEALAEEALAGREATAEEKEQVEFVLQPRPQLFHVGSRRSSTLTAIPPPL